jgi:hypothetical protein
MYCLERSMIDKTLRAGRHIVFVPIISIVFIYLEAYIEKFKETWKVRLN